MGADVPLVTSKSHNAYPGYNFSPNISNLTLRDDALCNRRNIAGIKINKGQIK